MAGKDRVAAAGLTDRLFRAGHQFELLQAVALLEYLGTAEGRVPVGEDTRPDREAVRFQVPPSLRFPATDVDRIEPPARAGAPPVLVTPLLGLLGHHGPLPDWLTEEIGQRARRGDQATTAFLNLFDHRLLSLFYRARARSRFAFGYVPPDRSPAAGYVYSMLGLGTPKLLGRMGVADRALLRYAGLMAGRTRSGAALERLLSDHLRLPVRIRPLTGRWLEIDPAERTRLGRTGANARLGAGATVGSRVWDVESCFTLEFGPLAYADHLSLLPGGDRHGPAVALTRLFAGETLEFRLEMRIRAAEVPRLKVSASDGARLGWTAFLRTSDAAAAPGVVRIAPRHKGPHPTGDAP
ncbi:MAG: type VI secretion system baseplate subunit TssG [Rhodospirillales bacterium]